MIVGKREKEMLSDSLVKEIINEHYKLGRILSISHLEEGHESDNSKVVTDKGEFAIKLLYHGEEIAYRKMIVLDLLTSHGIKAPKPIKTIDNKYYVIYKANIPIMVTSFIHGNPIAYRETGEHFKHMEFFGREIGNFHRISKAIPLSEIEEFCSQEEIHSSSFAGGWVVERYEEADKILPKHEKNEWILTGFEEWIKDIDTIIEKLNLSKGITHGDLFPGAFFVQNNELTGILDFSGGYLHFMGELGRWIMYTELHKQENADYFKKFIVPYLKHSEISIEELKAIPHFYRSNGYVQFFYFAWRCYHNLTHGLGEAETNMDGFTDGISIIESALKIKQNYFYDLALEVLKEGK